MNWIEEAPVPITATRLPSSECSWFHCAEWNIVPANVSIPSISGSFGSANGPGPAISISALSSPAPVSIRHTCSSSSQRAAVTSWWKRTCSSMPCSRQTRRRYSQISGCNEYVRVQLGLGANENEYRCEGMSHWQPG